MTYSTSFCLFDTLVGPWNVCVYVYVCMMCVRTYYVCIYYARMY